MDVIVAGAGIIGCAIAYELSRRGLSVEVFDPRQVGGGASHATAGVLAPFIEAPAQGPLQQLTLESFGLYDEFVASAQADSGVAVEYRRCGTWELAEDAEHEKQLDAVAARARAAGFVAEWRSSALEGEDVAAGRRGLMIPSQGYVRVEQLLIALRQAAERRGARFFEGQAIERIALAGDEVVAHAGGRQVTCGALVIAAGSWSDAVGSESVGIRPVRGQLVRLRWARPPLPHILWGPDCYIVPWTDGTILVGATVENVGFDERATADGIRGLLAAASCLLPGAADATFLDARAGLRPASADGLPVIRPSERSSRLIYATGHYRNGVLLAPLTMQRVAAMIR